MCPKLKTMEYPNKIYVCEYKGENSFGGQSHFVITITASSIEVAKEHVKKMIGIDTEPIWLMGAVHPTLYNQTGNVPLPIQAKILSNCNFHVFKMAISK